MAKTRTRRSPRREQVLRAARRLFAARGFAATSVAEIAAAAGVADGTVYTYFASKRDLLYAVLAELYGPLTARVQAELAETDGFAAGLETIIRHHLEALAADRDLCLLMLQEVRSDPDYDRSGFSELNRRYVALLTELVERGQAIGEVRAGLSPRLVRDLVYGSLEHVVWNALVRSRPIEIETITRQMLELLLPGLTASQARPTAADTDTLLDRMERAAARLEGILRQNGARQGSKRPS